MFSIIFIRQTHDLLLLYNCLIIFIRSLFKNDFINIYNVLIYSPIDF